MLQKVARILAIPATTSLIVGLLASPALSRRDDSGEVIVIYGCSPGYTKVGDGEDYVCISNDQPTYSWPASAPPQGGGGKSVPACTNCLAIKTSCLHNALTTQNTCYRDMFLHFGYQCSVFTRDVFGRGLNPRKYTCDYETQNGKKVRVCHGEAVNACMDQASVGASIAQVAQVINKSASELSAELSADPSVAWSVSKEITHVDNYNIFEGINASCTALGGQLAMACEPAYNDCLNDVSSKKSKRQCR